MPGETPAKPLFSKARMACLALPLILATPACETSAQERSTAEPSKVESAAAPEHGSGTSDTTRDTTPFGNSAQSTAPNILWQGLAAGMTPEEVLPIVSAIEGVKKAQPFRHRDPGDPGQIRISYSAQKIAIAGMPFGLAPRFEDRNLDQGLACGEGSMQQ